MDREKIKDKFRIGEIKNETNWMRYNLFSPKTEEGKQYPLVIYLHGAGERGENPRDALLNSGAVEFAAGSFQKKHPCFVFAPQCPLEKTWNMPEYCELIAKAALNLPTEYPIDVNRIYITGLSMGGLGTWSLISLYPHLFAAAMPVCGAGDPFIVKNAKFVPTWAFHAADDPVVAVGGKCSGLNSVGTNYGTRTMVYALRNAGGEVHYTEYPEGLMEKKYKLHPHASWVPAYGDKKAPEWMFSKTRYDRYEWELLKPGLWHIEDCTNSSVYLVEGKDKALVIDTGMGGGDFVEMLKGLTHLPLELAVTHVHGDHMRHSDKFPWFYMSERELPLLEQYKKVMMPENKSTKENVKSIDTGDIIDLGGGVKIEVFALPGHTPGSLVFIDKFHGVCFTGDTLGVWMQCPGATGIKEYKDALQQFKKRLSQPDIAEICFLGGHKRQEGGVPPFGKDYSENSPRRVEDMIALCKLVLKGEAEKIPSPYSFEEPAVLSKYKTASMIYPNKS